MAGKSSRCSHLLLRVARFVMLHGCKIDVVQAHNEIIESRGKVALAKHGRRASTTRIGQLKNQIAVGTPTYLILAFRMKNEVQGFAAPISVIVEEDVQDIADEPAYYDELPGFEPSWWIILNGKFREIGLAGVLMQKDSRDVVEVMGECRTSLMFVVADEIKFIGEATT